MSKSSDTSTQIERMRMHSRSRRNAEKEELQQAILHTAADLFIEVGYQGFSMRQVAERLHYTVGTLYHYYTNKDDLLLAVMGDAFQHLDRDLEVAFASTSDPLERLRVLAHAYVQFALTYPAAYQLLFLERPDFLLGSRQEASDTSLIAYRVLYRAMQQALIAGVIRTGDAHLYADAFWGQVHGIVTLHLRMSAFFDTERTHQALNCAIEIWLTGISTT